MKNKKGFTLVELLAVIAVLGIIMMVAVVAVLPMINKSRQKSLLNEGKELVRSAEIVYNESPNMRGKKACLSLEFLNANGYYEKGLSKGYTGSVLIEPNSDGSLKESFVINDGSGTIGATSLQNINSDNYTYTEGSRIDKYYTCLSSSNTISSSTSNGTVVNGISYFPTNKTSNNQNSSASQSSSSNGSSTNVATSSSANSSQATICKNYRVYRMGDIDMDGIITSSDGVYYEEFVANGTSATYFTGSKKSLADVDYDGILTAADATYFKQFYLNDAHLHFFLKGDLNRDRVINALDATEINACLTNLTNVCKALGDMDLDNDVDALDVNYLYSVINNNCAN